MQSLNRLALVVGVLGRQPEHVCRASRQQRCVEIPKRAALWRASPRARNLIPVIDERGLAGTAGAWVGEHDDAARKLRERDVRVVGGAQREVGEPHALEMTSEAVVDRS